MKIFKNDRFISFIKFCAVGASNTALSLIVYWILLKVGLYYLASSALAYMAGILNGYILSSRFVFSTARSIKTGIRFFIVYGISLLINLLLLYVLVDIIRLNEMLAQFFAIVVNTLFNYTVNKIWTFKKI